MKKLHVQAVVLAGILFGSMSWGGAVAHAGSITSYFTFENDGDLTDPIFGELVVTEQGSETLLFEVSVNTAVLGSSADIHEFGFMIDSSSSLSFNSIYTPFIYSTASSIAGVNRTFDYVVNFGEGTPFYNQVSFTVTGSGLSLLSLLSADDATQNSKPDAQFMMHVQSTATQEGSEAVGGSYGPYNPVPEPTAMVLFGAGLIAVSQLGRRRFEQK